MAATNVLQPSLKEAVGSESFSFGDGVVGQLLLVKKNAASFSRLA